MRAEAMEGWVEHEVEGCEFSDKRLKTRFGKLLGQLSEKIGAALPTACQDWAATKAAYRFFDNTRVDESMSYCNNLTGRQKVDLVLLLMLRRTRLLA